jgi:hypothetical protein
LFVVEYPCDRYESFTLVVACVMCEPPLTQIWAIPSQPLNP